MKAGPRDWKPCEGSGSVIQALPYGQWHYSVCPVCGFVGHRDLVGGKNIKNKYLEAIGHPVDSLMAQAKGFRYRPHLCCSNLAPR